MKALFIFFVLIFALKIHAQTDSLNEGQAFVGNPFIIERPDIQLPDSLGGKNVRGLIVITLRVDSLGVIHYHSIIFFKIYNEESNTTIEYRSGKKKDKNKVERYKNWIDFYVANLKLKKNSEFPKEFRKQIRENLYKVQLPIKLPIMHVENND